MFLVYRHDITSYSKVKKLNKKWCLHRSIKDESKFLGLPHILLKNRVVTLAIHIGEDVLYH